MKKLPLVVLSLVSLLATSCGGNSDQNVTDTSVVDQNIGMYAGPVGDSENSLNVLAWPGYAEDGSTDPVIDWVSPFEKNTGCEVNVKEFNSSQEAINLMKVGGYDLVSAPSEISYGLIELNKVQPINIYLLDNYAGIFDDLKERSWNSVEGSIYGVAQGRGANLFMYNKNDINNQVISWDMILNPEKTISTNISMHDSALTIAIAAIYLKETRPDLGITNPYALSKAQFDEVINLLTIQKPLVTNYWADYLADLEAVKTNKVDMGMSWQATINEVNKDGEIFSGTKPIEGTTGWVNSWMIANSTQSINCAYKWIDWMISPQTNALTSEWFGEAPVNKDACALTADKNHCAAFKALEDTFWEDIYYWDYPRTLCLDGRTDIACIGYDDWFLRWTNFRSS